jgi:hypothetical protein
MTVIRIILYLIDCRPYLSTNQSIPYNPYSLLCGAIPPSKEYLKTTTSQFNREIEKLSKKEGTTEFYDKEKGKPIL